MFNYIDEGLFETRLKNKKEQLGGRPIPPSDIRKTFLENDTLASWPFCSSTALTIM